MLFINAKAKVALAGSRLIRAFTTMCACAPVRTLQTITCVLIFAPSLVSPVACAAQPGLHADQELSTAGYYQLSWTRDDKAGDYLLEEREEGSGSTSVIYRGLDAATVVSGKPDGVYHYTLRAANGSSIGKPVTITVRHHLLTTAFNFFLVGAVVFIFILVAIIRGNRSRETQS